MPNAVMANVIAEMLNLPGVMDAQLQYMGRLPGISDVSKKYWSLLMVTSILNAVISMLVIRVLPDN